MTDESELTAVQRPIGVCMSGGGYRAAAFHLGALAYLYDAGLGQQIQQISTVSGGTFTGARYALSMVEGEPFERYFAECYAFLENTDLIKLALEVLAGPPPETPSRRHDLIVAIANVYAQKFMRDKNGEPYRFGKILDADIQLKEIVFNATEFRYGLAFRFQKSGNPDALIGNFRLNIDRADAAAIRMADIVAASSCFPTGFEPLSFPYDFSWPGDNVPPRLVEQFTTNGARTPVALMDGGIYDNQGVDSLLYADERDPGTLGMFIISDVDQKSDDLYPFPVHDTGDGGPTLGRMRLYGLALMLISAASVVAIASHAWREYTSDGTIDLWDFFVYAFPLALSFLVAYALWRAYNIAKNDILPRIPQVGSAAWKDLKKLGLRQLVFMANLRISSVIAMTANVFMKRIRSLVYGKVYSDPKYESSRVANLVYHLATGSKWPKELPDDVPQPSPELRRIADIASTMATTLWFDNKDTLRTITACGQATMCFNLMKWMARNHGNNPDKYPPEVKALWDRVVADWTTFVEAPYSNLDHRLKRSDRRPTI